MTLRLLSMFGSVIAVGLVAFGARAYLTNPPTHEGALTFNIPMPAGNQTSQHPGRCIPQRNIGIAESAEHYYASCRNEQK